MICVCANFIFIQSVYHLCFAVINNELIVFGVSTIYLLYEFEEKCIFFKYAFINK